MVGARARHHPGHRRERSRDGSRPQPGPHGPDPPFDAHNLAGWYKYSVTPGQTGSSLIVGHVDSATGPSIFFRLKELHKGDTVQVRRADGQLIIFAVDGVQVATKTAFPTQAVYRNTGYPSLRLVTCGGPFDYANGHYLDNIIVYAHLQRTA